MPANGRWDLICRLKVNVNRIASAGFRKIKKYKVTCQLVWRGAESFHSDEQTHMTKLTVVFRNLRTHLKMYFYRQQRDLPVSVGIAGRMFEVRQRDRR